MADFLHQGNEGNEAFCHAPAQRAPPKCRVVGKGDQKSIVIGKAKTKEYVYQSYRNSKDLAELVFANFYLLEAS